MGNLVLARYVNQSIMIGDDIKITVVRMRNGQVNLAIDAPKNLTVDRLEIYESKLRAKYNAFDGLVPNPEEYKAKADLALKINNLIEFFRIENHGVAALLLGITTNEMNKLNRGILDDFSIEQLENFLRKIETKLGGVW